MRIALLFSLAAVACGMDTTTPSPYLPGFNPPAPMTGYTRFITPVIQDIKPGDNVTYCQWVAAPSDSDQFVHTTVGYQSNGGHHIVMYANSKVEPVGTSRICTNDDMLTIGYLGAAGGEGNGSTMVDFPAGVAFKLPKGQAMMANTHFINATGSTIDGQAVVDVNFIDQSSVTQLANLFANTGASFDIPAGTIGSADINCVAQADLPFVRFTNHMHTLGHLVYSEVIHADGTKAMIHQDDPWTSDLMFNPHWASWPIDQPYVVKKGDTYHTHCEWNQSSSAITFPDEMCVGTGFFLEDASLGSSQVFCVDGSWGS